VTPSPIARVLIGEEEFVVEAASPFIFGRSDGPGIVGLDPNDMGISGEAGSIEHEGGVWWVSNRSRKRRLLIDDGTTLQPRRLDRLMRHAITASTTTVLVPGAVYTHRLEVVLPDGAAAASRSSRTTSGTLTADDLVLSNRDRAAVTALFMGYLLPFPRHDPRPRTYREAAASLGGEWTTVTVRKQVERMKERLRRRGLYFEGPRANDELAEYLLGEGALSRADLSLLPKSE
jgi:hypothetical protein